MIDSQFSVAQGQSVYCVNYSACNDQIIVATADAKPVVYDKNGNQVRKFIKGNPYVLDNSKTPGHTNTVYAACWHPTRNDICMTASLDGTCRIWDMNGHTSFEELESAEVMRAKSKRGLRIGITSGCYNIAGTGVALGCVDGGLLLFDERTRWVCAMEVIGRWSRATTTNYTTHTEAIIDVRYHPSGQLLVTRGRDQQICIWDTRSMTVLFLLFYHCRSP